MFQEHLDGKEPALGIIPINEENKCQWACIDIDLYNGFDHKELIRKINEYKFPLLCLDQIWWSTCIFIYSNICTCSII